MESKQSFYRTHSENGERASRLADRRPHEAQAKKPVGNSDAADSSEVVTQALRPFIDNCEKQRPRRGRRCVCDAVKHRQTLLSTPHQRSPSLTPLFLQLHLQSGESLRSVLCRFSVFQTKRRSCSSNVNYHFVAFFNYLSVLKWTV